MEKLIVFVILVLQGLLVASETPQFSDEYIITGRILLPYAELDEPFTAYYTAKANKSRVDYYGDLMQTLQRADLNQFYKVAYMVDGHGQTTRVCFNMAGSPISPVSVQSVLPDLSKFSLKTSGLCNTVGLKEIKNMTNAQCEVWEYAVTIGQKDNKYVFVLRRDGDQATPVLYIMMGYDSLLGSHYDKYEVIYESYRPGQIDQKVFDINNQFKCRGFPGPGHQSVALMNPIHEFIEGEFGHIDQGFDSFTKEHKKTYNSTELSYRQMLFRHNYRFIMSHNRKNLHYKLDINHLADRSDNEMKQIRGKLSSAQEYNGGLFFDKSQYDLSKVPTNWDWRLLGAVTPVKDQAICGSCWSFGTTGTIEGQYFVKTGKLLKLSQQQLVDCSWSEQNNGCDGGEDFRSYHYLMKAGGIATTDDYGPYLGVDGKCHDNQVKKAIKITGFYNITSGDADALKAALYFHGPVTIAIDASQKTFSFYSHGIYYDPKCSSKDLDHQVLAVGYGEINGEKYWLVKNSWSTYWGNDGYVLINQKNNDCGVLTDATFPIVE